MMKTKYILLTLIIAILELSGTKALGQDIHFSQFEMMPLQLDPSLAGGLSQYRGIINYRSQWGSIMSTPYRTIGASFDMRVKSKSNNFLGLGLSVYSDKAGKIKLGLSTINLSLAYHFKVSRHSFFSGGLRGGVSLTSMDPSNINFGNQYDGQGYSSGLASGEIFRDRNITLPSIGAGVSYKYFSKSRDEAMMGIGNKIEVGAAIFHVVSPDYSFIEGKKGSGFLYRYSFHVSTSFDISRNNKLAIKPSGYLFYQGNATNIVLGTYLHYNLKNSSSKTNSSIEVGAHVRFNEAIIPSLLVQYGPATIGFSYDVNLMKVTTAKSPNAFELSLRFLFPFSKYSNQARFE